MTTPPPNPRLPAVDGLRGLAVLAVLAFHADAISGGSLKADGGFLGVSVFFVISGFVLTRLVLAEHEASGTVDLGGFADRRLTRLAPAAIATVLVVVVLSATPLATWNVPDGFRATDALAALWNVTNWSLITMSTEAGYRLAHPLTHFWSLAVEAQLYVLFAVTVLVFRRGDLRRRLLHVAGWAWLGSLCMALVVHSTDRREEFGTDIRLAEFAVGVMLAAALPRVIPLLRRHRAAVSTLGFGAATLFVITVFTVTRQTAWLANGGYAVLAVVWAIWLCSALVDGGMAQLLAHWRLVHLGTISYSLYLVHWPVMLMLTDARLHSHGPVASVIRMVVSVILAEVAHFALERPMRRRLATLSAPKVAGLWVTVLITVSAASFALL